VKLIGTILVLPLTDWRQIYSSKFGADSPCLGNWKGLAEIPQHTLEDSEVCLEGENKKMFVQFMRKMLQWDPDQRHNAAELLVDPWLNSSERTV
jgi:serine/threonine protein kinase